MGSRCNSSGRSDGDEHDDCVDADGPLSVCATSSRRSSRSVTFEARKWRLIDGEHGECLVVCRHASCSLVIDVQQSNAQRAVNFHLCARRCKLLN